MATVVEVATESEEEVVINCVAIFYEEGKEGRILEKRTNFLISTVDLHVRAVSVFGKKSDAVCGFFGVFLIGFGTPFTPPSLRNQMQRWFCSLQNPKYKGICSVFFSWATGYECQVKKMSAVAT